MMSFKGFVLLCHCMRNCSGIVAAESPAAVARGKESGRETDILDFNSLKPININEINEINEILMKLVLQPTVGKCVRIYIFGTGVVLHLLGCC